MPVSSVNSFSAACIRSERGFLTSSTSIFWPLKRFQLKLDWPSAWRATSGAPRAPSATALTPVLRAVRRVMKLLLRLMA